MTNKLLWGILPFLTACTIDLEMQLEVGLKDIEELESLEDVDSLEDLEDLIEEGSDFFDNEDSEVDGEEDEDGMIVEESSSCDVELFFNEDVRIGEEIFAQWELMGDPSDETVVALLQDQEVIHIDFVSMDQQEYVFPAVEDAGSYAVYVASGADLHHPDCFAMQNFNVEEDGQTELEDEIDVETEIQENSCEQLDNLQSVETVQVGDTVVLEWNPSLFNEDLQVFMYNKGSIEQAEIIDIVENVGHYDLFIGEELELGSYGVSLMSLAMQDCLHYGINVEQNF